MTTAELLVPGCTCWRLARASRLAVIIDAADYFRLAKAAMLRARYSIMLIGWDFDTRIQFEPDGPTLDGPNTLGEFLSWLPAQRPELTVRLLKWDVGALQALGRGMMPITITSWLAHERLNLKLDGVHPVGAAHHQKIVVVDDAVAFCGGIDMTADRWDTHDHLDDDPRRVTPGGAPYKPWHDATLAVEGAAARALGDLARDRWLDATGESLDPPASGDAWPAELLPTFEDVDVAVARTLPEMDERAETREVEALTLSIIANTRRTLYVESQYLASRKIAEAIAARLSEPDGPEVVLVIPQHGEGWLRRKAMDGARRKLLTALWRADRHGHFRAYYPVTAEGQPIYAHAKVAIMDDRVLRVGSSNLNNRSLGYDTECDLAVDAAQDPEREKALRETVTGVRRSLICEHLGVDEAAFEMAYEAASGSLIAAIEALRGEGRSLRPFTLDEIYEDASILAENELADPESAAPDLSERMSEGVRHLAGAALFVAREQAS